MMVSNFSRRIAGAMMLASLAAGFTCASPVAVAQELIPAPAAMQRGDGHFTVTAETRIVAGDAQSRTAADLFADLAARTHGSTPAIIERTRTRNNTIQFRIDADAKGTSPESYTVDAGEKQVVVSARDPRGLFYGAVTLWQLLSLDNPAALRLPAVHIDDTPRFAWRGLMLDSARHFQSVEEIKQLLDAMALHKLNTFHWHLTDDQGWRIEIKQYPRLTEIGGCRIPAGDAGVDAQGKPKQYCGYYTQEQIRDVVAHAAMRQITVVPEIDVPGHAQAAVAAYPQLGVTGKQVHVLNEWGVNTTLFNVEESTFQFLENVLGEVIDLFPGTYIHVGGDEAVKDEWIASPRVQERMRELGVKDEAQMQSYLIKRLEKFLVAHDRRLIGWDEILDGGLPPEATVMSWRGIEGGITAANLGHDVVMSPSSELYLDYLQTSSPNEPPGRPATIPLKQVYAFEPVPAALAADKREHILGVQANVWTEHMRTFARVQHAVFPRIAALAETAWSPQEKKDWDGFLVRLPVQLQRYRLLGMPYATTPFEVTAATTGDRTAATATVALSNHLGYRDIRYTLDGSEPHADGRAYSSPLEVKLPVKLRAAVFVDGQPLVPANSWALDTGSLLHRTDEALAMCTGALMLRLEDDGPREGDRAIFNADIFNPCWEWKAADLAGIASIKVRAGRMPYYFQLAHDESHRGFKPAASAHGELQIRAGCEGAVLASVPLPAAPDADGFVTLEAPIAPTDSSKDLCVFFTGDTRPAMWVLDSLTLQPR